MRKICVQIVFLLALILGVGSQNARAQIDEDQTGAWYMYFWNAKIQEEPQSSAGSYAPNHR